jgi:hypothetical protein
MRFINSVESESDHNSEEPIEWANDTISKIASASSNPKQSTNAGAIKSDISKEDSNGVKYPEFELKIQHPFSPPQESISSQ